MKTLTTKFGSHPRALVGLLTGLIVAPSGLDAQVLFNVDFGVGSRSAKTGFAATGQSTNDFWNLYRHYDPKFAPGMPLVPNGTLADLKLADGTATKVSLSVTNAPGVWGNATGDPMYDTYIFAQNGSNITVTLRNLDAGSYHFFLYGHADPDVTGEQNSVFTLRSGTNTLGPLTTLGSAGWKAAGPWQERYQYVVFRDVAVSAGQPVIIDVAPGANGVAVLNGLQISSRGTSPPKLHVPIAALPPTTLTNLIFREVRYDGKVSDTEARFVVDLQVESMTTNEISGPLFEGDVAVVVPDLPPALRIASAARRYFLHASAPGAYRLKLELVAKISRAEPWNQISFLGPPAAIASVQAQAGTAGVEMQLLSGTPFDPDQKAKSKVEGLLGADRRLALRWQSKTTEVARKSLVTVDTIASALVTPTVIKFTTQLRYEILQAGVSKLTLALPSGQTLTRLEGDQVRDWSVKADGDRQLLTIDFIKPIEKSYQLTLHSEQSVQTTPLTAQLVPPQPLEVERESGSFTISSDDMIVEIESVAGLRQVNAAPGTVAGYRFYGRPLTLAAELRRIEPVLKVADRVTARLEETRLLVSHGLTLTVEKAGIYAVELSPQPGFVVTDVRGEGVEDWKVTDGAAPGSKVLRVSFASRVLGTRRLDIQLEQALKTFPDQITVAALPVNLATNETAQIGAASGLGIRLKTSGELIGLREVPASALPARSDELLAFTAEQRDWRLTLAAERLPARLVADVFNLITVGDGLVGGSATIRFGLINQGVQEFKVNLPAHWKNVEFTGPNIRRRDQTGPAPAAPGAPAPDTNYVTWTITLQDKAWGGYTLVVTYDYQFDPKKATLDARGAHALNVERETGSVAITTAASLQLVPKPAVEPLRVIDQSELSETDRALVTRPVLLAYRYTGGDFALTLDVTRHEELRVLDAVADRTQITSTLTEAGEMLTQASFMVKNNDKQFQRFLLPGGAQFWGCYVNNQPVKAERDGDWLLVSLPRGANRDEAFAVDIVYAQKLGALSAKVFSKTLRLAAPKTDVPNTYAEWQIYVPPTQRLSGFGGTMNVLRGTTYGLRDAWRRFSDYYAEFWRTSGLAALTIGGLVLSIVLLVAQSIRRGFRGAVAVLIVLALVAIVASMMLPALAKAKSRAVRINAVSNLKQVALAALLYANDHGRLPNSVEEMKNQLGSEKVLIDPESGERFVYVGAGKSMRSGGAILPMDGPFDRILAYSPVDRGGRVVAFMDGSVMQMTSQQFAEALQRDAILAGQPSQLALNETQLRAVREAQPPAAAGPTAPPASVPMEPTLEMKKADNGLRADKPADQRHRFAGQLGAITPGGAGIGGGAAGPVSGAVAPTAAGIRSIRIDIPRTGDPFTFTKVLNVSDEPLSVKMSAMKLNWFQGRRSALQLIAFLAGLLMFWVQWRRAERSSFKMTIGLALALGSVTSLMIALRTLHLGLIALVPVLGLTLLVWLFWRFWPRKTAPSPSPVSPATANGTSADSSATGPAVAALTLLACLSFASGARAQEQDSAFRTPHSALETNSVSILSATYTGTVQEKVAQFSGTLTLAAFATNQIVPLFGDDVALQEFSSNAKDALLLRQGQSINLRLAEKGPATVQFKFAVRLAGDVTKRQLAFSIPPALSSRLTMTIDEAEADVEFPTAVSFRRAPDKEVTRVEAVLGAGDRVEMFWTPRMKRIAEMEASIFAQNTSLVTVGAGVVNTRCTIQYQVAQGELRRVKVRLPAGQRLLRVDGELIRTWELTEEGPAQMLLVDLVKGVAPGYKLTVETEKILDKLPAQVKADVPSAQDVIRETGLVGVRGTEELSLSVEGAPDLQRVDASEFTKAFAADGLLSAYRFLKPGFQLALRAEAVQPEIEAVARNGFRIGFEQVTLSASVDYTIKKAGLFALRLALPAGYKVESVTGGSNILQWVEKPDPRTLEVALRQRTQGAFTLRVELAKAHKEVPKTLDLASVHPLDTHKLSGFVSVSSEPGVAVKTTAFEGLTEIPAAALGEGRPSGSGSSVLAYKFLSAEPQSAAAWKLSVATETVESWVRAEVVNVISMTETLVSGRAIVRYDIQNAPVKEFRLKVPAAYTNVEVYGADIRRRDPGAEYRVELQNKVRGTYTLTVTWEQPRETKTNAPVEAFGIEALGVERETGALVILAKPPLQVVEKAATDQLIKIDVRELPSWAGMTSAASQPGGEVPVLVYRYLRPGYRLVAEVNRFKDAEVLQALVDNVRLITVVADDGQMMTELALGIRNNGKQHLELELPDKATVWSAFVAGQPVRPTRSGNKLLLPLERSGGDEAPVAVELTYVGAEKFPKNKGGVKLASPKLDVPLKNARWELYLPPDYSYTKFKGSMTHEPGAAPVLQVFSSTEYYRQEQAKKVERQSDVKTSLSNARSQLASGKLKQATDEYNRALRLNAQRDEGTKQELEQLGKDVSKIQSSNLILSQRAYTLDNLTRYSAQAPTGQQLTPSAPQGEQAAQMFEYDAEVAERQWSALQKAQEVSVAKVQPLRVNLPTRGLRYAFSQVLQTEVNKPMTVEFVAANAKEVGWFTRLLYLGCGFVMLWIFVSVVLNRPLRRPQMDTATA